MDNEDIQMVTRFSEVFKKKETEFIFKLKIFL